jgi:hypothetical protein
MRILVIILLLLSFSLNAQTLFSTYKPLIDTSLIDDEDKIEHISIKLDYLSQYSPVFIYYYLQYLNLLSTDPEGAKAANSYLIYKQNEFCKTLDAWLKKQREIVDELSVSFAESYRIKGYLNDIKRNPDKSGRVFEPGYEIDTNYMNYIVILFYTRYFREYDESEDYDLEVNKIISAVSEELFYVYNNIQNLPEDKLEYYYNAAKQNPFLFKETINKQITNPVPVYFAEFLIRITLPKYRQFTTFNVGAGVELFNLPKDRISMLYDENISLETTLKNTSRFSYSAGLGVNIRLREYKSMFSSINFGLTVGHSSGTKNDYIYEPNNDGRPYYIIYYKNIGTRVDPNYNIDGSYNYSSTSYSVKASTPLIYIFSNFSIDCGVLVYYLRNADEAFISRHDKFYRNNMNLSEDLLVNYDKNTEIISSSTTIHPMFIFNYFLTGYLNFRTTLYGINVLPQFELLYSYSL